MATSKWSESLRSLARRAVVRSIAPGRAPLDDVVREMVGQALEASEVGPWLALRNGEGRLFPREGLAGAEASRAAGTAPTDPPVDELFSDDDYVVVFDDDPLASDDGGSSSAAA